jgi:hypothetical protein
MPGLQMLPTAKKLKFRLSHHMQESNINELDFRGR